jgi:hypothetical protein
MTEPKMEAPETLHLHMYSDGSFDHIDDDHMGDGGIVARYVRLDLVRALLATLPACDAHQDRPATRAHILFCDECGTYPEFKEVPEFSMAPALRGLVALVARLEAGE